MSGTPLAEIPSRTRHRVLLVEDYAPSAFATSTYLELWGFECTVAETGEAALEESLKGGYLAVLMDVEIGASSGFEITRHIRRHEKSTGQKPNWIIGLTAHVLFKDRQVCLGSGMDDYLPKPFDPDLLKEKLTEAQARAEG